jgi:ribosome maturation factor RimP
LLSSDREFITFKGFPVTVKAAEPDSRIKEWKGQLVCRDETTVYLNQKGRQIKILRSQIAQVELDEEKER